MKVLHVIPSVSVARGGPSRAIADMERALSARGIEVTTLTTDDDGQGRRDLSIRCGQRVTTPHATRWYFAKNTDFYTVSIGLERWLKNNVGAFDLVHAHSLFSFPAIAAAHHANRAGIPYVLRPLGVLGRYGMTQQRPLLKKLSLALIERRLIKSASVIHFTSIAEQEEAEVLRLNFRSVVLPLGIETNNPMLEGLGADQSQKNAFTLLYLSRIDPKKNIKNLLRAMALIVAKYPNVTLKIAGSGAPAYLRKLECLTKQMKLHNHVHWLGAVQGQEKAGAFASATAFVLPSFSENFGIAVVEALAAGVPCIVSVGVAISSQIKAAQAGIVVDTSPESIAAGIDQLFADRGQTLAMRKAARSLSLKEFSLEHMGERLEAMYSDILGPIPFAC